MDERRNAGRNRQHPLIVGARGALKRRWSDSVHWADREFARNCPQFADQIWPRSSVERGWVERDTGPDRPRHRKTGERTKRMRAVDAIMECLKAEGVDAVFGIPGGANLPTYDALYDAGIRNILCRHEQGAGHAAEGYAKASGKVGVALGTSGPGATNLVTAIADAALDSVPTVFLTGQVRTDLMGTDGFQEADTMGITLPIVKHSFQVRDPREIPSMIHEAFHLARTGRPGPVL